LFVGLLLCETATAQPMQTPSPSLRSVRPGGVRSYVTQSPGTMLFGVYNPTASDVEARGLTSYATASDRQYGRDVWVPAHAALWSWFTISAPPPVTTRVSIELNSLLYERVAGREVHVASRDEGLFHNDLVQLVRDEKGTAVFLDAD